MLHTATLIHDDIVDESSTRRGQASVNAIYDNKIAVLVGDYILSTALINVSDSKDIEIIKQLSILGQTLSDGEILQLTSNVSEKISEQAYYEVIRKKTAALFEAASAMGAMSVNASINSIEKARSFGQKIGMIFQIRDDIFDYYDSGEIGKPTGNDMLEGKLTLPAIYAILSSDNAEMKQIAMDVKACKASAEEIARLIDFSKQQGGIKYAEDKMMEIRSEAMEFINKEVHDSSLKNAFTAYLDYAIERNK
jgi:octaprenyl-diphosphate synthase